VSTQQSPAGRAVGDRASADARLNRPPLEIRCEATAHDVVWLRNAVAAHADHTGVADVEAVRLAVSEAANSVIPAGGSVALEIGARRVNGAFEVTVDGGDALMHPRGAGPANGLAFALISFLSRRFQASTLESGGVRLRMDFDTGG
jgi:hypothetical protein